MERNTAAVGKGAIPEQVGENSQPRPVAWLKVTPPAQCAELLRRGNEVARDQVIESFPSMLGQKLVVGSGLNRGAIPELHAKDRLDSVVDPSSDTCVPRAQFPIQPLNEDVVVISQLVETDSPSRVRVENKRVACQASAVG